MTDATTSTTERLETDDERDRDDAHLDGIEVGAGCTEIWEHLADRREKDER